MPRAADGEGPRLADCPCPPRGPGRSESASHGNLPPDGEDFLQSTERPSWAALVRKPSASARLADGMVRSFDDGGLRGVVAGRSRLCGQGGGSMAVARAPFDGADAAVEGEFADEEELAAFSLWKSPPASRARWRWAGRGRGYPSSRRRGRG